ncbi:MAG TPA: ATP-dependent DNA helicase, partial [Clostridiales bacterium UBA8960]|nr:ATP-dependent DNA helicase [Clostridiales bacterium UBA8960]
MIQNLIKEGESKTVEFKVDFPQNNQISQTVCAFANRAGGYIIIGVSDKGEVLGLNPEGLNNYLEKVPNIIHDSIFPMILPEIYTYSLENKSILVIQVFPGSNVPYYIKSKGKIEGTYVRVGRTNKLADIEMIKELERQRLNKSFDEDIYDELFDEDAIKLSKILENEFMTSITMEKLLNLKMIERTGDRNYLTNAGAVVIGKMSHSSVKCAKFLGESVLDFIDKKEYSGDIFSVLRDTMAFLMNHLQLSGLIKGHGLKRKDVLEIPEEVLRRGIINALMHRDYSIT